MKTLFVLTGCTGVGKSEAAVDWAEASGAEIVSCDSLLFYRGMDIGTARPPPALLARVPHHLIDCAGLRERMDVARYAALARRACAEIAGRGRRVLVVGGSGFYLKSFFAPVADEAEVPASVRTAVAALPAAEALARLRGLNPGGLAGLDTANPRRVARALERCLATGRSHAELLASFASQPSPFADWTIRLERLDLPPAELEPRLAARVQRMLSAGLLDEVRRLVGDGLKDNPSASRAIGYRECIEVVEGRAPESGLAAAILQDTRALVKKQRTWFRTQLPGHTVRTTGPFFP